MESDVGEVAEAGVCMAEVGTAVVVEGPKRSRISFTVLGAPGGSREVSVTEVSPEEPKMSARRS